jgi:hypothetical protein
MEGRAMINYRLEVNAPFKYLWEALTDYPKLPSFQKDLKKIEVRKVDGNKTTIWHEIEIIKPVWYILEYTHDFENRKLSWRLVDCGTVKLPIIREFKFMEKDEGWYDFSDNGPDKCVAMYSLDIVLASKIPNAVTQQATKSGLPGMMNAYKKRAEELFAASKK